MSKDKRLVAVCLNCAVEFKYNKSTQTGKYCSCPCSAEHRRKILKEQWLAGDNQVNKSINRSTIKKFLIEDYGYHCMNCNQKEWLGSSIPLELDHKDGDASNNSPNNVWNICPNCHAIQTTWKGRNKGKGRKARGLPLY